MKTAAVAGAAMATAYRNKTIEMKNIGVRSDKFMNRTDGFATNPFMNEKPTFFSSVVFCLSWLYLGMA